MQVVGGQALLVEELAIEYRQLKALPRMGNPHCEASYFGPV